MVFQLVKPMEHSEKSFNRYLVIVGALITQICLGSIYAWSIFQTALKGAPYSWDPLLTQIPFSAGLASFAGFMVYAGRLQDRIGPTKVATIGGILLGTGYILGSFGDFFSANTTLSFLWITLTYGVIGGAGIGFAYVCPIAALVKWFPDIKGLITGVAVAGFGAGALIFAQVETYLIELGDGDIGLAFLVLGIIYLIAVGGSAQLLRNPPANWTTKKVTPAKEVTSSQPTTRDYEWREMIRTPRFWLLWTMFVIAASAGLMTIGNIKSFVQAQNISIDAVMAATIIGILSIFNGLGRIAWGAASDRIGRTVTMAVMFGVLGITMVVFGIQTNIWTLTIGAGVIGFCFGGNFALFPSATADSFGTKNVGINYGFVFTAYGVAGILGPSIAGWIVTSTGGYSTAFLILGISAFIASALAIVTNRYA